MKKQYTGKIVGYARVSTDDQNLNLQIDALIKAGCYKENIYADKVSGAKSERPGLLHLLEVIRFFTSDQEELIS